MLTKNNSITVFGFTLPEVFGKVEKIQMYPNGITEVCFCVYADTSKQPLETKQFIIPPSSIENMNGDAFQAVETWLLTATEPKDLGSGLQEVPVLEGDWYAIGN